MKRDVTIDVVKGVAIWLMVLAHSNLNSSILSTYINAFHMPVFFFVSGFFYKRRSLKESLVKDFKSLVQPYIWGSIFALLFCWISPYLHPELYPEIKSFIDIYIHAFIGFFIMDDTVTSYSFLPLGPLWFLPALFFSKCYFNMTMLITENKFLRLFIIGISVGLYFLCRQFNLFSLDSAFLSVPFLFLGYYYKKNFEFFLRKKIYILVIAGFLFLLLAPYNGIVNVDAGMYGKNLFLFYLNAVFGILFLFSIIQIFRLEKLKYVSLVGEYSIIVLIFHLYMIQLFKVGITVLGYNVHNLHIGVSFIISLLVIYLNIPLIKVISRKFSYVIGR